MKTNSKFKTKFLWISSLILITILLVFSVFQVNTMTIEARLIQDYENKLEVAIRKNETLIIDSARINSLSGVKDLMAEFGFKSVGRIYHIQILENQIVIK